MSDEYTNRCEILSQFLLLRKLICQMIYLNKNVTSDSPNYASYINHVEGLRKEQSVLITENPWLDRTLMELGKGT